MSHYDIHYSGRDTKKDRDRALSDCMDWFGPKKLKELIAEFRAEAPSGVSFRQFEMIMAIGGVQGYPVKVLYQHIWPSPSHIHELPDRDTLATD